MAIDLNKLIADAKARDKLAKEKLESAQKSANAGKVSSENIAKSRRYRDYAYQLMKTRDTFEQVVKRYASKIARGDKLDSLEQDELDNAIEQYNKLDSAISKAQLDAYNVYIGGEPSKKLLTKEETGGKVTKQSRVELPMGAGTIVSTDTVAPTTSTKQTTTTTNKPTVSGSMPQIPTGGPTGTGIAAGAGFNPARFRMGEEASMGAVPGAGTNIISGTITPGVTTTPSSLQTLLKKTEFWYDLPDYIFETVPGLGDILVKAVNENWDKDKFLAAAQLTPWWQSNIGTIREKIINKAKYNELRAAGNDVKNTAYGQYLSNTIRSIKSQAKDIAGVTLDDAQAQQIAEKIYDGNLENDALAIKRLIIPFIGKVTDRYAGTDVTTYGGQALQNYQVLQGIAKANGLTLKDILPQVSTTLTGGDLEKAVLQGLASGDIDINRVAQNARMVAAQGQPQYVRDLLNQGYDLEQVYAPYKKTMATLLELNQDQIDLNDPTLRSAINNNGDMNVYDFKKVLRKDPRWQYTENARQDVSDSVLSVLRNFGFQG